MAAALVGVTYHPAYLLPPSTATATTVSLSAAGEVLAEFAFLSIPSVSGVAEEGFLAPRDCCARRNPKFHARPRLSHSLCELPPLPPSGWMRWREGEEEKPAPDDDDDDVDDDVEAAPIARATERARPVWSGRRRGPLSSTPETSSARVSRMRSPPKRLLPPVCFMQIP